MGCIVLKTINRVIMDQAISRARLSLRRFDISQRIAILICLARGMGYSSYRYEHDNITQELKRIPNL